MRTTFGNAKADTGLRPLEGAMFTRLTVTAALALLLLLLAAGGLACGDDATADDFVGTWRETDEEPARTLRIQAPRDGVLRVTYRRFYPNHGEFRFEDAKLTHSAMSPELVDVIEYDSDDDTITITSGASGRRYTLTRIDR
jgi:hypothetical protein